MTRLASRRSTTPASPNEARRLRRDLGYWKLTGKLFPENEASVRLVRGNGWREVGLYLRHAQLEGRWRDVLVMERLLD